MKHTMLVIALLLLTSCGQDVHSESIGGAKVDPSTLTYLEDVFYIVKDCTGLEWGEFYELDIVLMPPVFACLAHETGCVGEYHAPTTIKIGSYGVFPHEIIHYLLFQNTWDSDYYHESDLFLACGSL